MVRRILDLLFELSATGPGKSTARIRSTLLFSAFEFPEDGRPLELMAWTCPTSGIFLGMTDAVIGLIGVVGGAVVGGAAAIYGPLLLRQKERRDARRQHEGDRVAMLDDQRLVALTVARVRTRNWYDFLLQTVSEALAGDPWQAGVPGGSETAE